MITQAILMGIITAIIAAAALSLTLNLPIAMIFGASIGIVAAIAVSWEYPGKTRR